MYDLLLRDATIVQSTGRLVADIALEDGKIAYVGNAPGGKAKEEVSAIGHFVMPGVIDGHVHFPDVRIEYQEVNGDLRWEDVEVTTEHYRGAHGAAAARQGVAAATRATLASAR